MLLIELISYLIVFMNAYLFMIGQLPIWIQIPFGLFTGHAIAQEILKDLDSDDE